MKRIICALVASATLAACSTLESNIRDGQEYLGEYPVLHTGILVDIQIPDKQNNLNSLANEAANTLNTGTGSAGNLVDMATGLGPAGGGIIVGILSTLLESYAKSTPRTLPQLLIKQPDGEIISLGIEPHHLRDSIDFNCIQIGDPIKIIHDGYRPNYLNGDTRLQRKVFVEPSCQSLREKYGITPPVVSKSS